ncbi:hypothetical protein PGTUg99_007046 [Puccinia graminis f. sp. tritici]|uniref:CCHC-type domain-containing protein n=1 Tax=Puccinia graminis f. sp. tritici TaxID=56615 RepID=A0A5B0NJ47_PUCGR|nr:hypothetical protein PGTUg99_007046 [Puccinia graminis f. sp. tritici]
MEDLEVQLPSRPSTKPPASSLHIILTKAFGENAKREANGSINLDAGFVELILDLSANNERLIQQLEATVAQLNAKVDPLIEQMAEFKKFMKTGPKPATNAGKSFAGALVQKANEALLGLDARVDGEAIAIRGASMLPSGNVSFYTKNRAHQKWLMDNKHVWSKAVHPDLEATPSTWSVMAHGIPKSFDVSKSANLALLASENSFQATNLARVRWMGSNETSTKKAGSLVLAFTNKDLALQVEKSGIFLNYDYHRTEHFKPRPPQCFKCLKMGHFGRWCREPARCAKCNGKHPTNECPEGIGGVNTCVLCKEGVKNKTEGVGNVDHTPFNMVCPYKKAWFKKKRLPSQ